MRTRIKICGLTRCEDVDAAVEAGADALGFIFYPGSARYVSIEAAQRLVERVPPFVHCVGLFVNAAPVEIDNVLERVAINMLQFHGDETEVECLRFQRLFLKAVRVKPGIDLLDFAQTYASAEGLLLDTDSDQYGGSGQAFDWSLVPPLFPVWRMILSGGLTTDNVADAVRRLRPAAVDVCSGVEVAGRPGIKDWDKIFSFAAAVRRADAMP